MKVPSGIFVTLAALAAGCLPAYAQSEAPAPAADAARGNAMATRPASRYLERERALLQALRDGKREPVQAFLAPDFDARTPAGADAQDSAQWLDAQFKTPLQAGQVRNLAVRSFDTVDVVDFLLDVRRGTKGRAVTSTWFVVDVWQKDGGRLLARYASLARKPVTPPTRPDGRE